MDEIDSVRSQSLVTLKCNNCNADNRFIFDNNLKFCFSCRNALFDIKNIDGFVYVLSNQAIPNLFKIGYTLTSVEQRVSELNSSTSIPEKFEIELVFACGNPRLVESQIHSELSEYRHNDRREFFRSTFEKTYSVLRVLTKDEPIFSRLPKLNDNTIKHYSPWQTTSQVESTILRQFICPNCQNTARKHHQNKDKNASFYCKKCRVNYNASGVRI